MNLQLHTYKNLRPSHISSIFQVRKVLNDVKNNKALDNIQIKVLEEAKLSLSFKNAIDKAANHILYLHRKQKGQPIDKVGLYVTGRSAPLTVLMLGIPAYIAGCKEIVLCSPPDQEGKLHPAILYAAQKTGIQSIYKIGGAQAIAAMAYGTKSIPSVDKIFGTGNSYVTTAKQLLSQDGVVAIDMPASELAILADDTATPSYVAADFLSQAEHGQDSLLIFSAKKAWTQEVFHHLQKQFYQLKLTRNAQKYFKKSCIFIVENLEKGIELINEYAPEHLIINCKNYYKLAEKVINAGTVFLVNTENYSIYPKGIP